MIKDKPYSFQTDYKKSNNSMFNSNYNERLFNSKFRKFFHLSRFRWLKSSLNKFTLDYTSVLEIGCHDAKSLFWLPYPALKYVGLDADWEGGLGVAKEKFKNINDYHFIKITSSNNLPQPMHKYDIGISLETFEHLSDYDVDNYIRFFQNNISQYIFISIPNEIGIFFLFKFITKYFFGFKNDRYTLLEFVFQTIGHTSSVERDQHKGFSWKQFILLLKQHFTIVEVKGIPFSFLPVFMNFGVGVILKNKI